jgi:hypothetical protein
MELLGVPARPAVTFAALNGPEQVRLGSVLEFSFTVRAQEDTQVIADYVLHHQGKNGRLTGRKVYKLKRFALTKGEQATLTKRHLLRADMTTRQVRPGRHELEIQLNGVSQRRYSFWITASASD